MNTNETFWIKSRFFLIFTIMVIGIFILSTKFIFKIPVIESKEMLNNINNCENIFLIQQEYTDKVKNTHNKIEKISFDIIQVQVLNEIDKEIELYRKLYRANDMNNRFFFSVHSSKILKMYFNLNEEFNAIKRNNEILLEDLEECKANI